MPDRPQTVAAVVSEVTGLLAELEKHQRLLSVMFTDIAGSTSYFERHGDLMGMLLLQRVESILKPLVGEHDGVVVKTIGDAVMAYFENPIQAVRCGIAMQRGIARENRKSETAEPIRIRIAVNLGMAILRGNDVFGDVVNVCSRIEHAARPVTVCVSPSVVEALRNELDLCCSKAGCVAMRGKAEKMDLYEVDWEGHATVMGAPKTELSADQLALAVGSSGQSAQELRTVIAEVAQAGSATRTVLSVAQTTYELVEILPGQKPGRTYPVGEACTVMGTRGPDIVIDDPFAAPQHAAFTVIGGALYVDDVSEGRGVFLQVRGPQRLTQDDLVAMGRQRFRYHLSQEEGKSKKAGAELIQFKAGREGRRYRIPRGETTIGRKDCTITFSDDPYLSRLHCRLQFYGTQCILEDLNSSNGSYTAIRERQVLDEGDTVLIGEKSFRVQSR